VLEWLHYGVRAILGGVDDFGRELGFHGGAELLHEATALFVAARCRKLANEG
jgi:hypothetical protein